MFVSNRGYGILFDITSNGKLTWSEEGYTYTGNACYLMDYYFFYGPSGDQVIAGYRTVTGQATMLPKGAFGYVQSRNRYGSQEELLDILDTFDKKNIPVDTIVIDYFWWKGEFNNILEWGESWPDPDQMMKEIHDRGVSASISVWPSFKPGTPTFEYISKKPGFLMDTPSGFGLNYDPSSEENRKFYWSLIEKNVFSRGLDSIWLDACEPENSKWVWDEEGEPIAFGNSRVLGILYPLLTNMGVYGGQRAIPGNQKRVNSLSRGAVAGIQRYGIQSWSGDIPAGWEQLRQEIRGVVNFSAAGLPYFSTDTGGYFPLDVNDSDSRECFFRWLQMSTFNSIMRVHGTECKKEPWQFGARIEAGIVDYIRLRERLIPYIYSLAGWVTHRHYTMVRPLVFDFPGDQTAATVQDQFMFGPAFMVCPVYTPGAVSREVYLPKGRWINFWNGETIESKGETITAAAPLKQIPLFIKAGSIVPMGPHLRRATDTPDPMELRVYMGADGEFVLYEDEGNNYNYEQGAYAEIPFTWNEATKTLTIGKRSGSFEGMLERRTFNIVFVQPGYGTGIELSPVYQASILYDGNPVAVEFDPNFELPPAPLDVDTLPVPAPLPAPGHADKALVGEWSFSEGEGAKTGDRSGNFNSGSLTAPTWTTGIAGSAVAFDGTNAVKVADSDTLKITREITCSAFVYPEGSGYRAIVNKGGHGHHVPGYFLLINTDNKLQVELQNDRSMYGHTQKTTAVADQPLENGKWQHVAFTWKSVAAGGDGIVRIYVDGVQVSDDNNPANRFEHTIGTNRFPLLIGRSNESNFPLGFVGKIDEVKLFSYALTAEESLALSKLQPVTVPNVSEALVLPGGADGSLTLTWQDPDVEFDHILVVCNGQEYVVDKGAQNLTISGLAPETDCQIAIKTVLASGKTSEGSYLAGKASNRPVVIDCVVTHLNKVYGYLVNRFMRPVDGTLQVSVKEGDTVVTTAEEQALTVPARDMIQFSAVIGEYKAGQTVELVFTPAEGGKDTASASRQPLYLA